MMHPRLLRRFVDKKLTPMGFAPDQIQDWLAHPVTVGFQQEMLAQLDSLFDAMLSGGTPEELAGYRGQYAAFDLILDLSDQFPSKALPATPEEAEEAQAQIEEFLS